MFQSGASSTVPDSIDPVDPPDEFDGDGGGDHGDEGDPVRWVTVASYWNPSEAHIARLKLESEEIDCVIVDENLVATQWLWANALGGVKVQVPEPDASRAVSLLETTAAKAIKSADGESLFDGLSRCPQCGSDDIYIPRFSRKFSFLSILLLGLPIPFIHRNNRCAACGFEWKLNPDARQ